MFKFLVNFGIGLYAGIYLAQNYNVPPVNNPEVLFAQLKEFIEKHKKN